MRAELRVVVLALPGVADPVVEARTAPVVVLGIASFAHAAKSDERPTPHLVSHANEVSAQGAGDYVVVRGRGVDRTERGGAAKPDFAR